ncbi:MAG: ral secretion pathway protein, partial [Patescibacteria group bacterium]|nr:ral secretion pathway protein [Patescibacteria group bacterium]
MIVFSLPTKTTYANIKIMKTINPKLNYSSSSAFTIVELLIVIVIIGILAAITLVSYTGIASRANIATIQSDLSNASKKLSMYY